MTMITRAAVAAPTTRGLRTARLTAAEGHGVSAGRRLVRVRLSGRGGRIPAGAVRVDRRSPWGNPYKVADYGRERAVELYREHALKKLREDPEWLEPLRGRDLACWCKPGELCHADVLLELLAVEPATGRRAAR